MKPKFFNLWKNVIDLNNEWSFNLKEWTYSCDISGITNQEKEVIGG